MNAMLQGGVGAGLMIAVLAGCGLRDSIKGKKEQESERASQRSAESARKTEEGFRTQEAAKAQKELESRRRYFLALEGDFEGGFEPALANAPNPEDAEAVPADSDRTINRIRISLAVLHDFAPSQEPSALSAEQLKGYASGLALAAEVTEEVWTGQEGRLLSRISCGQQELKPDVQKGMIRFTCLSQTISGGREYQMYLADLDERQERDRSVEGVRSHAASVSERLRGGAVARIDRMKVRILSPFGKEFLGVLEREGSSPK